MNNSKHRYIHTLSLSVGGDPPEWEGEVTVSYTMDWGRTATPPTYSHGGSPAEDDEVGVLYVTHIDGEPVSEKTHGDAYGLEEYIAANSALLAELVRAAHESEANQ